MKIISAILSCILIVTLFAGCKPRKEEKVVTSSLAGNIGNAVGDALAGLGDEKETASSPTTSEPTPEAQESKPLFRLKTFKNLGKTYEKLTELHGAETEGLSIDGGNYICFENSKLYFQFTDNNEQVEPTDICIALRGKLSAFLNYKQKTVTVTELEKVFGCTAQSVKNEADGSYTHSFTYKEYTVTVTASKEQAISDKSFSEKSTVEIKNTEQ